MTGVTRVHAVVPAYDPDGSLVDLVAALAPQVDLVVVVDDGSRTLAQPHLAAARGLGAIVLRHDANRGIAAALNTGIAASLSRSPPPDAVLTLDQDSRVGPTFVRDLRDAWSAATEAGLRVGLVAPERVSAIPSQTRSHRSGIALGRDPIQSGVLLPATTWGRVGTFDETLFIDGVDADYALRCLDAGFAVVVAEGVRLGHTLGHSHDVTVAGRRVRLTRAAPFRYYYLARNRVRLVRRHGRRHPRWAVGQTLGLLGHVALVELLVPGRAARAAALGQGIRDAARGVTGPRPNP